MSTDHQYPLLQTNVLMSEFMLGYLIKMAVVTSGGGPCPLLGHVGEELGEAVQRGLGHGRQRAQHGPLHVEGAVPQ